MPCPRPPNAWRLSLSDSNLRRKAFQCRIGLWLWKKVWVLAWDFLAACCMCWKKSLASSTIHSLDQWQIIFIRFQSQKPRFFKIRLMKTVLYRTAKSKISHFSTRLSMDFKTNKGNKIQLGGVRGWKSFLLFWSSPAQYLSSVRCKHEVASIIEW